MKDNQNPYLYRRNASCTTSRDARVCVCALVRVLLSSAQNCCWSRKARTLRRSVKQMSGRGRATAEGAAGATTWPFCVMRCGALGWGGAWSMSGGGSQELGGRSWKSGFGRHVAWNCESWTWIVDVDRGRGRWTWIVEAWKRGSEVGANVK